MNQDLLKRLNDALEACRTVRQITSERELDEFELELVVQLATERLIGIIGEALTQAAKLDPELVDKIPDLRLIVGMRNRIIHAYDGVDGTILMDSARNDISLLERQLVAIVDTASSDY